ncbi:MAG TPA: alkaline phosphatase family protein [Candidatus Nanoarchaeia archaeon]|nr:alkaline phosphatase family protein [Candidatus Nanoarchaeia archaeon]
MKCIFLDGFKSEYLQYAPYLRGLAEQHLHGKLEVPFGYTSIVASFMTGFHPDKHGVIDVFEKRKSPAPFVIKNKMLANGLRYISRNLYFYSPLQTTQKKARFFKPAMKNIWMQKGCLPLPTIFDYIEMAGKTFSAVDWPFVSHGRRSRIFFKKDAATIMEHARKLHADFNFIHFGDLDELGHIYGPDSEEVKEKLKEIDGYCKELDEEQMIFFSDHGMDYIQEQFDLEAALQKLDLKFGKDYTYFIASTYARFWFHTADAREKVVHELQCIGEGDIIDQRAFHLPATSHVVFLAKKGIVFSPSFFTKSIGYKAMHGWSPKEQKSFYLVKGSSGKQEAHMVDLFPTVLAMMGLPEVRCDGKCLL